MNHATERPPVTNEEGPLDHTWSACFWGGALGVVVPETWRAANSLTPQEQRNPLDSQPPETRELFPDRETDRKPVNNALHTIGQTQDQTNSCSPLDPPGGPGARRYFEVDPLPKR